MTQHSISTCKAGKTFGCIDEQNIWVRGCRGEFQCGKEGDRGGALPLGAAASFFCGYPAGDGRYNCSCNSPADERPASTSIGSPVRLGLLSARLRSTLPIYQQPNPSFASRSSPIERACKLVVFKHITKAGGSTLGGWFQQLQMLGWFNFFSAWYDPTAKSTICPYPQPRQCWHGPFPLMAPRHAYILSRFEARILHGDDRLADGWLGSVAPSNISTRIPLRTILEIHATDDHLPELIAGLDSMRPLAATSGCGVLAVMLWREPVAQYISLYKYSVVYKREKRRFEDYARANAQYQASDLLRGTAYLTSHRDAHTVSLLHIT